MSMILENTIPISVIVPVYNTKKWLPRCIDSILAQTFTDFELILVNDGSTDYSGKICDSYAATDQRIRVMHKSNGGVSSARNAALDIVKGQYIAFIDADDYIDMDYLAAMWEYGSDIIISGAKINELTIKPSECENLKFHQYNDFLNNFFDKPYVRAPWAKLYSRQIIQNHHIRFDERIRWGEDYIFFLEALTHSQSISLHPDAMYHYEEPTAIGKYKFTTSDYQVGLTKSEQLLMGLSLTSFASGTPLDTNRLWHFYSMRDYVNHLTKKERLDEWKFFLSQKLYNLLPKSSTYLKVKCLIEFFRITHR